MLILTIRVFTNLPKGKYYDDALKASVNANKSQVIEVGKRMKIDNATIHIERIINTKDSSYIRYTFVRFEVGWSFSGSALKIFDDKGKGYNIKVESSLGRLFMQDGLLEFDRINKDSKYLIIKLDWYDQKNKLTIPLGKEGEINENQ